MWIFQEDERYNDFDHNFKFKIEDPVNVPRVGERVNHSEASGWVKLVQYEYHSNEKLVINIMLSEDK